MRKIKYRAKVRSLKGKSKWVKGFYYEVFGSPYILPESREREPSQIIDRETLGAFIQRTDKNGVEVYEGDIINSTILDDEHLKHISEYYVVEWECERIGFICRFLGPSNDIEIFSQKWFWDHIEVVGNRWENPNLLKAISKKRGRMVHE